jgi:hypothetical protein
MVTIWPSSSSFNGHVNWAARKLHLRVRSAGRLRGALGLSVVETQLGYLEFVAFNPIHHAVLVRDSA